MPSNEKTIFVYADWKPGAPTLMGRLYAMNVRGKEIFSFEYDEQWLNCAANISFFDPDLQFFGGRQYAPPQKANFGVFSDSCPDRFGRKLMNRREALLAKQEGRKPRALTESDYLLGVFDDARMGALRFSLEENGAFLSNEKDLATPPWTTLRTLENASLALEDDNNKEREKWLQILLAPGSSLGGARPKASVMAPDGSLWIAKFPSKNDEWDCGAWEMVAHDLAVMCGLNVPEAKLERFSDSGSTFLVKRFDRIGPRRLHYSSAMTLLGKTDGDDSAGYLDLVSFIKAHGNAPKKDLEELFRRVVFSIAVSNTDDHLRNHGFLLGENGWQLSPVFDVNPSIYGENLSLNINEHDNTMDFALVKDTASYYDLSAEAASEIILSTSKTVADNWKRLAEKYRLSRSKMMDMEPAFMAAQEILKESAR
jgi:serine/threonine-protein kinase HipA